MRARRAGANRTAILFAVAAIAVAALASAAPASAASGAGVPKGRGASPAGVPWAFEGQSCRLLSTASPRALVGGDTCGGVRPGAPVLTPVGQCTLNFLWRGSDGRDYIGTAGHCLLEGTSRTQAVFGPGDGPPARDAAGHRIGEFAYAVLDDVGDFALIRLDPNVGASPEICRFGGPTGIDVGPIASLTPLHHVGRGTLTGGLVPARTQLAVEGDDIRVVTGLGVASAGDSGSPLVDLDGRAVGLVVATGPALPLAPTGLFVFSMRIAPEMGRASRAMGVAFDLVTAPLAPAVLQP
ncbi:MAG: hypothetical protein QOG43_3133 [Actinomycetota bacterium]|jgi:hypothetical protein|nr:hypothetical protein [Actinomycetota bacterium]